MAKNLWQFSWLEICGLVFCYIVILAGNGYVFGAGDQVEVLPYALFLQDAQLYPSDFYVQYISQTIPNERYLFSKGLSLAGSAIPVFCALLHLFSSLFLLGGWHRLSQLFIRSQGLRWGLLLMICLPPLYGINLGGNELYYNTFIPSLLAKSIGVWGLYYFLKERFLLSFFLLVLTTLVHPVAGAQLFLILSGVLVLEKISSRIVLSWQRIAGLLFIFLATAGAWVFYLKINFDQGSLSNDLLFEIMEFRVAHHYFPSYFPLKAYALLLPLFAGGTYFYFSKDKKVFWFFILALLGCLVYTIGVQLLQSSSLLTAQWFKSTIWLKAFSLIALLAWIEQAGSFLKHRFFEKIAFPALGLLALLGIVVMAVPFSIFKNRPYDFFFAVTPSTSVDIALKAKAHTPQDAVFIIPADETAFKYFSQRSCYIDYKTVVHRKTALPVWYQRVREVYGIGWQDRQMGHAMQQAEKNYGAQKEADWKKFSERGVAYLLMPRSTTLHFPVLVENEDFRIYQLQ